MKLEPFEFAKVKIETNDMITKLFINGQDFSGAFAVKFEHMAGEIPKVTVVLPVDSVEIDGHILVEKRPRVMEAGETTQAMGSPIIRKWESEEKWADMKY